MNQSPMNEAEQDLSSLSAGELAARIASGAASARQAVLASLARIEAHDPALQAFVHLDREQALARAAEADALQAHGAVLGPLHGVPVAIKDVIDTQDYPAEHGSPIYRGNRPAAEASCVQQLRAAGAIIVGKTVTAELASLTPGPTRNPVNPAHTPGGSSSGSAAAVAALMTPLALGTQTAGSVLRPASYCGIYGFKPTLGLISRRGVLLQSHTLDTVGVLARTLGDVALAVDCMGAHDPADAASFARQPQSLRAQLAQADDKPLRLAFLREPGWAQAEPAMRAALDGLCTQLGAACAPVELPASFNAIIEQQALIQFAENSYYYGALYDEHRELLSAGMQQRLEGGLRTNARDYLRAVNARETHYGEVAKLFAEFDAILTPAAPGPAPLGLEATGSPVFNGYWTFLGVPALSMPLMQHDDLPMGLQITGPRHGDGALLRTARRIEALLLSGQ